MKYSWDPKEDTPAKALKHTEGPVGSLWRTTQGPYMVFACALWSQPAHYMCTTANVAPL